MRHVTVEHVEEKLSYYLDHVLRRNNDIGKIHLTSLGGHEFCRKGLSQKVPITTARELLLIHSPLRPVTTGGSGES